MLMFEFLKSLFTPPRYFQGKFLPYGYDVVYVNKTKEEEMIKLGDLVQDEVTGFKGVAVAKYSYLQGCDRFSVQPEVSAGGSLPVSETFDGPQLQVLERGKVKRRASAVDPGGPEKCMPKARQVDSRQCSLPFAR